VAVYLVAMAALGLHLGHALASVFQTFGFLERYAPMIQRSSYVIGALIALGFMSIPLYVNLAGKMPTAG
jgi:succinate dehydrogenase / fumarate reductase cytochrome b subunit